MVKSNADNIFWLTDPFSKPVFEVTQEMFIQLEQKGQRGLQRASLMQRTPPNVNVC